MDKAVVVISLERERLANAYAEKLLGPLIVRHIGVQITSSNTVQAEKQSGRGEAKPADLKPVGQEGQ